MKLTSILLSSILAITLIASAQTNYSPNDMRKALDWLYLHKADRSDITNSVAILNSVVYPGTFLSKTNGTNMAWVSVPSGGAINTNLQVMHLTNVSDFAVSLNPSNGCRIKLCLTNTLSSNVVCTLLPINQGSNGSLLELSMFVKPSITTITSVDTSTVNLVGSAADDGTYLWDAGALGWGSGDNFINGLNSGLGGGGSGSFAYSGFGSFTILLATCSPGPTGTLNYVDTIWAYANDVPMQGFVWDGMRYTAPDGGYIVNNGGMWMWYDVSGNDLYSAGSRSGPWAVDLGQGNPATLWGGDYFNGAISTYAISTTAVTNSYSFVFSNSVETASTNRSATWNGSRWQFSSTNSSVIP